MNGELAGCDFKWEFTAMRAHPTKFYATITEPTIGCLTILLQNQSRLVQLLEAKDQEIQDYTLNGAVLSRKSLQTTIFDPKKEALTITSGSPGLDLLEGLESPEYSEALDMFRKSERPKDIFIAPGPPTMSKADLDKNTANSLIGTGNTTRKRGHLPASSTASLMKGPTPMQASQKQSQDLSEAKNQDNPQMLQQDNPNLRQQENCSSPQQVKRTRASRTSSANASKNLLKKL